jgi:glycosyltransferase involved in cell wall biosynthesis
VGVRILQLTDFYKPVIGGLERHVEVLAQELARRGHQVAVATLAQRGAPAYEQADGVRVYRLGSWSQALRPFYVHAERRFHPPMPDAGVVTALRGVIRRERPQIIHAHGWILYSALPLVRREKIKLVVTLHDYGLVCTKKTMMYKGGVCNGPAFAKCLSCARAHYGRAKATALTAALFASRRLLRRVDRFLAVSGAVADASACGAQGATYPIAVVPTFIPDALLDGPRQGSRPAFLPPEDGYLLFVGVLGAHKGLHVLLDAYRGLDDRPPLVLIGTSYGGQPVDAPEGVWVARNVPHGEVMAAWDGSAVGTLPSIWPDPSPQAVMEAMASGTPVVASAIGGIPDLVQHGETGLLVPPGDSPALRRALRALLSDPPLRARMGEAARRRAAAFTLSHAANRIEAVYREVLDDRAFS